MWLLASCSAAQQLAGRCDALQVWTRSAASHIVERMFVRIRCQNSPAGRPLVLRVADVPAPILDRANRWCVRG